MEKISKFNFEVEYVAGIKNVLVDLLPRFYSNDVPGTVHARSEYTYHDMIDNNVLLTHDISVLVCMNLEAVSVMLGAESGQLEMGHEFAAQIRNFLVLKGPQEQKEGEDRDRKLTIKIPARKPVENRDKKLKIRIPAQKSREEPEHEVTDEIAKEPEVTRDEDLPDLDTFLLRVVSEGRGDIDLPSILRNNYGQDLFFKTIVENPKHYQNFEVDEGLIYLRVNSGKVLCIPKILVEGQNI
jgi:hypothetical protein